MGTVIIVALIIYLIWKLLCLLFWSVLFIAALLLVLGIIAIVYYSIADHLIPYLKDPEAYRERIRKEEEEKAAEEERLRKERQITAEWQARALELQQEEAMRRKTYTTFSSSATSSCQTNESEPARPSNVNHGHTLFDSSSSSSSQSHRDNVSPWENYARQSDREQGWYCNHDHHSSECDD